jgi:O-antigen ligase
LALVLGIAILGYVTVGTGGSGGGLLLISVGLLAIGLFRARGEPAQSAVISKILSRSLMLLPGALVVYLSFNAGGFSPGSPARVAVLLALILAARLALASDVRRPGRLGGAIILAFVGYAAWVLASAAWSGAPERAMTSVDYVFVYGLGFVLFATSASGSRDIAWVMRGLALGSFIVCTAAFLSRAVPTQWPISARLDTPRLSYPLTYWNALGLLAAMGVVLCVGLTSHDREPRALKALSAAAVPLLATTLLLTFSRGPIAACMIGLIVYIVFGRPRSLVTAAIVVGPTTALAVVTAYRATSLQTILNGSAAQARDGHHLALIVAVCMLVAGGSRMLIAGLDPLLLRIGATRAPIPRIAIRTGWACVLGVAVVLALALDVPGAAHTEYSRFVDGDVGGTGPQLRDRLSFVGADGRIALWKVAFHEFDSAPLAGTGAGTYAVVYAATRPDAAQVLNAHSLYFENLAELGAIGAALLACIVLGSLVVVGRRARMPDRTLYAAALAAAVAWAIHAGFDWDWQMPAVTLPAFVLAGAAVGSSKPSVSVSHRRSTTLALMVLVIAIVPALMSVSQVHLDNALADFGQGDCASATMEARSALAPLSFRTGAHEVLGYCHAAAGAGIAAESELRRAVGDDPKSWEPRYGLAIVDAAAGHDPRPEIRVALELDPLEAVILSAKARFAGPPSAWSDDAVAAPLPVDGQYGTDLAALQADRQRH